MPQELVNAAHLLEVNISEVCRLALEKEVETRIAALHECISDAASAQALLEKLGYGSHQPESDR